MRKSQTGIRNLKIFTAYVYGECKGVGVYVNAFIVGAVINFFTVGRLFASWVPYLVPVVVQIFSRSSLRFVNRFRERLTELPVESAHPVFIMNMAGEIILSGGHTLETFQKYDVNHITDFVGESGKTRIFSILKEFAPDSVEVYSHKTCKWYEARAKIKNIDDTSNILVWFDDITERKILDSRFYSMLNFSHNMLSNLDQFIRANDSFQRLAMLIIDTGYEGVFIAKSGKEGQLEGVAFKKEGERLVHSQPIVIMENSPAPAFLARRYSQVIYGDLNQFDSRLEFDRKYPFDIRKREFFGFDIHNFVSYHEGGFTIEAFNKQGQLNRYDSLLVETLLNHTRSVVLLLELAEKNDEQFLQKVIGLCAAAEYSDEITGKHILRINEYARMMASELGYDNDFVHTIGQVAALHDIGKVAIPEFIKLQRIYTREESAKMHMHTIYGAKIIRTMIQHATKADPRLDMAYNIALHHHQRWDGSGYPGLQKNGEEVEPVSEDFHYYHQLTPLKGTQIPPEALITAIADDYDALRSRRPYKQGLSHKDTCKLLAYDGKTRATGAQRYSPEIWKAFDENHRKFEEIFRHIQ